MTFSKEMKFAQAFAIISLLGFFTGCDDKKSEVHNIPLKDALLEGIGTLDSPRGTWSIAMTKNPSKLVVSRKDDGIAASVSPNSWNTSEGAFVYLDDEDRVWAYDGIENSFIVESTKDGTRAWDFKTWEGDYPTAIKERIKQ